MLESRGRRGRRTWVVSFPKGVCARDFFSVGAVTGGKTFVDAAHGRGTEPCMRAKFSYDIIIIESALIRNVLRACAAQVCPRTTAKMASL